MKTIEAFLNSIQLLVVSGALAMSLMIGLGNTSAAEPEKSVWQRVAVPKTGLPKVLTKPAKVDAELPPKEAAKACIATAKDLFDQGYDREATLLFERARQLDPKRVEVSRYLGVLYDRQNDPLRANVEYERALKLTPKDADLLNDVGYFHYRRGKFADAEKWYRSALNQNPKLDRAQVNLAMVVGQQARYQESYDLFAAAVGPAAAHSNVGVLLAKANRTTEAIQEFRQALALEPDLQQPKVLIDFYQKPLRTSDPNAQATAPRIPVLGGAH